jgi:hypothetical protein
LFKSFVWSGLLIVKFCSTLIMNVFCVFYWHQDFFQGCTLFITVVDLFGIEGHWLLSDDYRNMNVGSFKPCKIVCFFRRWVSFKAAPCWCLCVFFRYIGALTTERWVMNYDFWPCNNSFCDNGFSRLPCDDSLFMEACYAMRNESMTWHRDPLFNGCFTILTPRFLTKVAP